MKRTGQSDPALHTSDRRFDTVRAHPVLLQFNGFIDPSWFGGAGAAGVVVASPASADPYTGPRTGGGDAQFLYLVKMHIAGISNT